MNTTKSVYNKLFSDDKVELASERVELGLVDEVKALHQKGSFALEDLQDATNGMISAKKVSDEAFKKANDAYDKLNRFKDLAQKWEDESVKVYSKIMSTAKELGIPVEQIGETKELQKRISDVGKARAEAQRIAASH